MSQLKQGGSEQPSIADLVLYAFLQFVTDEYQRDILVGGKEKVIEVYGKELDISFKKLKEFEESMKTRDSVQRKEGERASEGAKQVMGTWANGIWD